MYINQWHVRQAIEVVREGGIIAYPTEAVWGVGCDPFNEDAVMDLLKLKNRPMHKGLILAAASIEQVQPLIDPLSDEQKAQLQATWPGPNTWLIPDPNNLIPHWVKGDHDSVAIRVSAHPLVHALTQQFGGLLVSTSANPATATPAKSRLRVKTYFGDKQVFTVGGSLGEQKTPTTIRDITTMSVIRR